MSDDLSDREECFPGSIGTYINDAVIKTWKLHRLQTVFLSPLSTFPLPSNILGLFFLMESHAVLDRQLPPSSQEISTLDHNLERTGSDGRHSLNASISTPIPVTAFRVDKRLPPSITEMHTSDHDLEKSGCTDSEKASTSIPVTETETLDIEHVPVQNDPRKWSSFRKVSF